MLNKLKNEKYLNIYSSLIAIIIGLLFGLLIMLVTNPTDALFAFINLLVGGFSEGITKILFYATPLILTGLSVGFAFKTGLFNIGAPGQLIIGAITAIMIGVYGTILPGPIHFITAIIGAGLAGSLWGLIPGLLKAYRNVNEVVSTIMMNYIGLYFTNYLVIKNVWNLSKSQSRSVPKSATIPTFLIGDDLSFYSGIIIALLAAVAIYIILNKTTFGFQLKAVGFNKYASKYAGINEKKSIVYSMLIAGCLAGLAGATIYLAGAGGRHLEPVEILPSEGFNGIPIALIGLSNPIGIFLTGIFMSYLQISGDNLQLYDLPNEIIDIIISSIIYFSAFVVLFRGLITKRFKRGDSIG
jgi:simple sugar transport system permease protein